MVRSTNGKTQKEIVFGYLKNGISKPTEIVDLAKEEYGIEIGKGNINQIKMAWKRQYGANEPTARPKARPIYAEATVAAAVPATTASTIDAILDLVELVGVAKARAIIAGLK